MTNTLRLGALLVLLLPASAYASHIELVTNGGFETGDLTGWTVTPTDLATILTVAAGGPNSGTYFFLGFDNSGFTTLAQTVVPTNIGSIYDFSFFSNTDFAAAPGNILRYQLGTGPILTVANALAWTQTSTSYTATGVSTVINLFYETGVGTGTHRIDDVSFRDTHVIPEPSTGLLVGLGLFGLITRRTRSGEK